MLNSVVQDLRHKPDIHPFIQQLDRIETIKSFMEVQLCAVWDFMSLLKSLQSKLTCISIPWIPSSRQ